MRIGRPRAVFIAFAAAAGCITILLASWIIWNRVAGERSVFRIVPRYTAAMAEDVRFPPEHHATMQYLLNELPRKRTLTVADASAALAIVESPPPPDARAIKRERYPDQPLPDSVWIPINAQTMERSAASGVLSAWLQTGQPMDPGVRERIIEWIVRSLDHADPRERASAINDVLDTRLLRERPDLRPKIEAMRDDPDDHVALVARLQLERYDEREALKNAWEAKHGRR